MSIEHLIEATIRNDVKEVYKLLKAGVNPNDYEDEAELRPIHFAALYNALDVVSLLVGAGADIHVENLAGETALNIAQQHNHKEMAFLLMSIEWSK
jgi:uncharacterized protein